MSQYAPMYIVAQNDDEAGEPEMTDFRPKVTRQQMRFSRRKSVAAEHYDPEADDEDDGDDVSGDGCEVTSRKRKSEDQRRRLREAVAEILIFRSLESDQIDCVIDAMFERQVEPGEHVIRQGDDGDNFYVIETGSYDVKVRDESSPATAEGDVAEKRVHRFEEKGSFGELALMYNVPRSATVTAVTSGLLWAMDRKSFRRIVLKSAFRKRKRYERLLESVPMLSSLDNYERMNLADALTSAIFQDGDCIIRVGAEADGMYFVEEGEVRVMVVKDGTETEVARMGTGCYFGEMALVENSPRTASVYAVGRTRAAFLERKCFERLLGPCLDIMKRNIDAYRNNS